MAFREVVLAVTCLLGLSAPIGQGGSAQAATLDVRGGILFGAKGVVFGGKTFNVEFIDSSCPAIYGGCDSVDDFDFTDNASARIAAQALSDQVVIDGVAGLFDTNFTLTNGCTGTLFCAMIIPTAFNPNNRIAGIVFLNTAPGSLIGDDRVDTFSSGRDTDLTIVTNFTYAKFNAVPVPAALPLMLGGLGLLAMVGRRRRG